MNEGASNEQYQEAQRLFKEGAYEQALAILDQLVLAKPNAPDLLYARAVCLAKAGRAYEAAQLCNRLEHQFGDKRGATLKAQLAAARTSTPTPSRPAGDAPRPLSQSAASSTSDPARRWYLLSLIGVAFLIVAAVSVSIGIRIGAHAPQSQGAQVAAGQAPHEAGQAPPEVPQAVAEPPAPSVPRGIAVLASSIGTTYAPDNLTQFVAQAELSHVIIDWAWVTYHFPKTQWHLIRKTVEALEGQGVHVAAMYRPRSLEPIEVPTQVNADGSNALSHGYEIDYFDESAKGWGIEWGTLILANCPTLNEIIIYNPRNLDASPRAHERRSRNPAAGTDAIVQFLREARTAWQKRNPDIQIGVVTMPGLDLWARASSAIDTAYPFWVLRDDANPSENLAGYQSVQAVLGGKVRAALTKVTWEEGYRVSPATVSAFRDAVERERIPHIFWTLETLADAHTYTVYEAGQALQIRPGSFVTLHNAAAPPPQEPRTADTPQTPATSLSRSEVNQLFDNLDRFQTNAEKGTNIQRIVDLAKGAGKADAEYIRDQAARVATDPRARPNQRWMSCYVLSGIGDEEAIPVLGEIALNEPNSVIRSVAAAALGDFASPEAKRLLQRAAQVEAEPRVQTEIAKSLGRIDQASRGQRNASASPKGPAPKLALPPKVSEFEPLPWPHQDPGLNPAEVTRINEEVWVINDFPLYQADEAGESKYIHGGLDVVLDNGTKIYAMKDGWVKSVRHSTIVIADTGDQAPSFGWEYTHLGNFQVKEGDFVKRGTWIGEVQFKGLAHIHLTKVFSQAPYWGKWAHVVAPNQHFTYRDTMPPILTSIHFFRNESDEAFPKSDGDPISVSGDVDIVVAMRDPGEFAHSRDNGFGDRLAVARIEYEIAPSSASGASARQCRSFDFHHLAIKKSVMDRAHNTELAGTFYKHWKLFESHRPHGSQTLSYYVITNCPAEGTPREITVDDGRRCWQTAAVGPNGAPLFPDGHYTITVTAHDFAGNRAQKSCEVHVANHP